MDTLRIQAHKYIQQHQMTWYELAQQSDIDFRAIYRFRSGGGMNGDNTIKLMQTLKITPEDLR